MTGGDLKNDVARGMCTFIDSLGRPVSLKEFAEKLRKQGWAPANKKGKKREQVAGDGEGVVEGDGAGAGVPPLCTLLLLLPGSSDAGALAASASLPRSLRWSQPQNEASMV